MTVSVPGKAAVAVLVVAGMVERADGKRSPKNSSSAPVRDLEDSPAVTVIQNQPPK